MKTTLLLLFVTMASLIGAQGKHMTANVGWTVTEVAGPITDANGTNYTVMLHTVRVPGSPRQNGNLVLSSPTPFTGVKVGDTVTSVFDVTEAVIASN